MKTPWLNYKNMQETCSNQIVFKSSTSKVQNICITVNLICKNEERKDTGKGICEIDIPTSFVNLDTTNNPQENIDVNNLPEQHEINHNDSTHDLYELSDGIFSKHVSKIDDCTETENVLNLADSSDCKDYSKTISAFETTNTAQTDFIDKQQSSESDFINQMKDFHDQEDVHESHPDDEPKDTSQTDFTFDLSGFINEMKDLHDQEEVEETNPEDETIDASQTDFPFGLPHPTESDFMNEMKDLHDQEKVEETNPENETIDAPQTDFPFGLPHPTESDFMNEMKDLHDQEEVEETNPENETIDAPQTDFPFGLPHPTESDFMNEMKDLHDQEKVEETNPEAEPIDTPQTDSAFGLPHPAKSDFLNKRKDILDIEEMDETSPNGYTRGFTYNQGEVYFMTKNSPFSIHVEIDDFLHAPIYGEIVQNTFEFPDVNNKQTPELETKLINTTTYYPEQPDCRLVCSKIHEIVFLTDDQNEGKNNKGNHYKSVVVPMHDSLFTEAEESNHNSNVHIRVPVVLGEYKIEICLEENITFNEEVMGIKEISKEVILSNFRLVPTELSQSLNNGTRTVLKGHLFIEGCINQKIEYTAFCNKNSESLTPLKQVNQKMAVELMIHIQQVQQVRVKK